MIKLLKYHSIQSRSGNVILRKAFFVVLAIWLVTLTGAAYVYLKNKQLAKLSAFVNDYQVKLTGSEQNGQEMNEEKALLFVKFPNKKLILTKYTNFSKKTVDNITAIANTTIINQGGPVIISKPKKTIIKNKQDFYIKRVPQ